MTKTLTQGIRQRYSIAVANAFPDRSIPHLLATLLLMSSGALLAAEPLPELASPGKSGMNFRLGAGSLELDSNDNDSRFTAHAETSQHAGTSVGVRGARSLTDRVVFGGGAQLGGYMSELYANLGLHLSGNQRLVFSVGQLRQKLEFDFPSGKSRAEMTQNSGGISWRFDLGAGLLDHAELNAYTARTASRNLSDASYAIETATVFELWNDPRRIAGGRVGGVQGKVGIKPWEGGWVSLGLGHESLRYDLLAGAETHNRATASLGAEHAINRQTRIKFSADAAAAQIRYLVGVDHRFGDLGTLGINLLKLHGRDGASSDTRVQLSWTIPLGEGSRAASANLNTATQRASAATRSPAAPQATQLGGNLLDQVAARPAWMPSQVIAKRDTTAAQTRLVVVDKTALPADASIDSSTGVITAPIGVAVTGIAGVTRNGAGFVNAGQFALSGNNIVIDPQRIEQPAVGVTDVYVVTVNNAGGGSSTITVNVQRGSVKIVSIVVASGPAAPTASAVSIAGTTQVGQTLTGSYTYADTNGDAEGTSTFRWLRNGIAIAGATASTYTLVNADFGAAIAFEVTPVATVAPTTGTAVVSAASAAITLPAGYVSQGGLIWMPNNIIPPSGIANWTDANAYCTVTTLLGQTGWRLPTREELLSLHGSGAMSHQGWTLTFTWSSTPGGAGYVDVSLLSGSVSSQAVGTTMQVTCVR